jgi:hypothetical protein
MPFEKTAENWVIELPDEDHMGPAMRRLNEKQRRFVCALSVFGGDQSRAYAFAGYGTTNPRSTAAASSRLANSDDIKEAIKEEAWRRLDYSSILAISTMVELASPNNPDKAVRLKAADMLSKRTGFHEKSEHLVIHEDRRSTKELIDFIQSMGKKLGVAPLLGLEHQPVIDTTCEDVVEASAEGLEDLL